MKKIFYIHILLMTVTCFITYTQQYNDSSTIASPAVVISQNGLMSSFNPYQGTQYHTSIFVGNNTLRNRRERRAQGIPKHRSQHETKKVTSDDVIERINNKIDKKVLGIKNDGNCCCNIINWFFRKGTAYMAIDSCMSKKGVIQMLQEVDNIIQAEKVDSRIIMARLAEKNEIFGSLIYCLVNDDKWITGSTIDRVLNFEILFPFSDSLYRFIERKKEFIESEKEPYALASLDIQTGKQLLFLGSHNLEEKIKAYHTSGSLDVFLCEVAFQNSMDDNEELDALLDSDLVKNNLEGSPFKKKLIQAINEQKEKNNNKKWW